MAAAKKPMTEKQRLARLENIKKARGPKTPAGKQRSARNATSHGGWARGLYPILGGPLQEDPAELERFVEGFLAEFDPEASSVLRQAVLDLADKSWRLTRAQRYEAQGYAVAEYTHAEAENSAWLRFLASEDRRLAEVVRGFPDHAISDDDLDAAFFWLGRLIGLDEEDMSWIQGADRPAVEEALSTLIDEHFKDTDEAAGTLEASADQKDSDADEAVEKWRPYAVRREIDGSFVRNAERLVAHASREYDRALRRYELLADRFGNPGGEQTGEGRHPEEGDSEAAPEDPKSEPTPGPGEQRPDDDFGIFSRYAADEVVEILTKRNGMDGTSDPPTRNKPKKWDATM